MYARALASKVGKDAGGIGSTFPPFFPRLFFVSLRRESVHSWARYQDSGFGDAVHKVVAVAFLLSLYSFFFFLTLFPFLYPPFPLARIG